MMLTECPRCGSANLVESPAPPPHHARRECGDCGAFLGWAETPMTFERAAAFVMPFGAHGGERLDQIPRDYLTWARDNIRKPTIHRAIVRFLEGPDRAAM